MKTCIRVIESKFKSENSSGRYKGEGKGRLLLFGTLEVG